MDGFFGIGFGELIMIAIVALIVLGPERLPGALREVAKFIRMVRNLSREFTDQFGDEFKALEDLDPRRMLQDAINDIDEEEKSKDAAAKPAAKKSTTSSKSTTTKPTTTKTTPAKSTPAKPTPAKSTTPKPTTAASTAKASTTATETVAAEATDDAVETAVAPSTEVSTDPVAEAETTGTQVSGEESTAVEPRIVPPELMAEADSGAEAPSESGVTHTNGVPPKRTAASVDEPMVESTVEPTEQVTQTNGHTPHGAAANGSTTSHATEEMAPTNELASAQAQDSQTETNVRVDESVVSDPVQDEEKQS
ncbi:MAG TPA: Sec-independent protein translocase protein TatB [Caldilineaceae bacterium]|nr:Sec-independent protein translocase protein TatB [Caldilineaceae bacterium]